MSGSDWKMLWALSRAACGRLNHPENPNRHSQTALQQTATPRKRALLFKQWLFGEQLSIDGSLGSQAGGLTHPKFSAIAGVAASMCRYLRHLKGQLGRGAW